MWHMHTFVARFALTSMASASGPALNALVHVMPRSKGLLASQALYCSATAYTGPEVGDVGDGAAGGRGVVTGMLLVGDGRQALRMAIPTASGCPSWPSTFIHWPLAGHHPWRRTALTCAGKPWCGSCPVSPCARMSASSVSSVNWPGPTLQQPPPGMAMATATSSALTAS